jgi:hypothetical protein
MIILAFLDPEPTSKLGHLVGGGTVCVLMGGIYAIRILTSHKLLWVKVSKEGVEIRWD